VVQERLKVTFLWDVDEEGLDFLRIEIGGTLGGCPRRGG
jgi:hypothetical protein